jgi:hypothetical protein
MSTPTIAEQDDLRSRLPDPSQIFPELAGMAGAMFKVTLNGSIPQTTISRRRTGRTRARRGRPHAESVR